MAKNKNTFEKRRREMNRMQKAQEKRERRFARNPPSQDSEARDGSATERERDPIDDPNAGAEQAGPRGQGPADF